jgi:hypothetical protein
MLDGPLARGSTAREAQQHHSPGRGFGYALGKSAKDNGFHLTRGDREIVRQVGKRRWYRRVREVEQYIGLGDHGEGWRKGETRSSRVNKDGPIDPEAIKIHGIRPADLKNAARFPRSYRVRLRWRITDRGPLLQERDFLDYEFARAKEIQRDESAYAEERWPCHANVSAHPVVG